MILEEQVFSFLFSFIFGIVYCILFKKLSYYLIISKYYIVLNMVFNFLLFSLYFLGIIYLNGGFLHIYFLLFFVFGFLTYSKAIRH